MSNNLLSQLLQHWIGNDLRVIHQSFIYCFTIVVIKQKFNLLPTVCAALY